MRLFEGLFFDEVDRCIQQTEIKKIAIISAMQR